MVTSTKIYRGLCILALGAVVLQGCRPEAKITSVKATYIEMNSGTAPVADSAMTALVMPYASSLEKDMNAVLALCELDMFKGVPEGVLGNFIADLTLIKTNQYCASSGLPPADICMLNNGGLRTTLPKGPIYKKRIFELMPFENEMVVLTISGEKMKGLLDFLARINGMPVSGMRMAIEKGTPADVTVGDKPFDVNREYRVATSDYLAEGGDKMNFFLDPLSRDNLGRKLRDAIIEYISEEGEKGNPVTAKLDGRITVIE